MSMLQKDLEKCDEIKTASFGLFIKLKNTLSISEHLFDCKTLNVTNNIINCLETLFQQVTLIGKGKFSNGQGPVIREINTSVCGVNYELLQQCY